LIADHRGRLRDLRRQKLVLKLQGLNFTLSQLSLLAIKLLGPKEALEADFRMFVGVEDVSGEVAVFEVDLLPGSDPFLLGLDYDRNADTISTQTPALWMPHSNGKRNAFPTYLTRDNGGGLRRFFEFRQRPPTLCTHLSQSRRQLGALKLAKANPDLFARKLHGWSHYSMSAMRILTALPVCGHRRSTLRWRK
jgi:hypothetical protein